MILIYQMGKVASRCWYQAVTAVARETANIWHIHHLAESCRQRLARALEMNPPRQTILNRIMPREQLRKGTEIMAQVASCRARGETIRIITGMRDPVARSVSLLMFMADFYGHTSRKLAPRQGATESELLAVLGECWESIFRAEEPEASFEWVARNATGMYRTWFTEELAAVFGIDVLSSPFADEGFQRFSGPGVEVLVYRVEDLDARAPKQRNLIRAASDMLGLPLTGFPAANTAADRRSFPLYVSVRDRFQLRGPLLDAVYADPHVRHFYTAAERAAFRARWAAIGELP